MFCHQPGTAELFQFVAKVDFVQDPKAVVFYPDLYPRDEELLVDLLSVVSPLESKEPKHYDGETYVYVLKRRGFAHVIIRFGPEGCFALCIISDFLHPKLFSFLLSKAASDMKKAPELFRHFHQIEFKENRYNRYIEPAVEWACPITGGLNEISELETYYLFLLTRYPPYLIGVVLGYLFCEARVIVLGSSLDDLSTTVLAFANLLYPLQRDRFLIDVKTCVTKAELDTLDEERVGIVGCHMSLINDITDKWKTGTVIFNLEVPYLTAREKGDALPAHMADAISRFNTLVVETIKQFRPAFPIARLFRCVCALIAEFMAGPFNIDPREWEAVKKTYEQHKAANFESFKQGNARLLKSRLTSSFFEECTKEAEQPDLLLKSYYPEKFNPNKVSCVPRPPLSEDVAGQKPASKDKRKSDGLSHPMTKK